MQTDPTEGALSRGVDVPEVVRASFPALKRVHNGHPVAYFDGPGGSQIPDMVGRAMTEYLYNHNANRGWAFAASRETDDAVWYARGAVADWMGGRPEEVAFGPSMTALTFQLSRALARTWREGDNIVVTEQDHHANIDPWQIAATECGVEVRVASVNLNGSLDVDDLVRKVSSKTRLVAFAAASNVLGTVNDVGQIVDIVRRSGAYVFIDAVHYSGHRIAHAEDWGCDFLACSAYKFYGPRVAALWTRRTVLDSISGYSLSPAPSTGHAKFEAGALSHEAMVGAAAALDYLAGLSPEGTSRRERLELTAKAVGDHEAALVKRLWNGLRQNKKISLLGPPPSSQRTATISFSVQGHAPQQVCQRLGDQGLFLSHGNFYAESLLRRLGYGAVGLVRAGCMMYTTAQEVDRLVSAIGKMSDKQEQ